MSGLFNLTTVAPPTSNNAGAFFGALSTAAAVFGVQVAGFILIKDKLPRLYQPRTYLVPERERATSPPKGFWRWIVPVWKTSSVDIVHKCGLDAYFFLRFLAVLIKIFLPLLLVVVPVLFCVNAIGGRGPNFLSEPPYSYNVSAWNSTETSELNLLAWSNVRPDQHNRYWAHLILALLVIGWCMYVFYDELRGFVRLRQAYLLSPQHRIRASATTVLVQALPSKWCNVEALEGLFDVYPGGLRNIWINRNYDKLLELVKRRDKLVNKLEKAETELIRKCRKAHLKKEAGTAKAAGEKSSRKDRKQRQTEETSRAEKVATAKDVVAQEQVDDESPLTQAPASPGRASSTTQHLDKKDTPPASSGSSSDEPRASTVDPRIDKDQSRMQAFDASYDSCYDGDPVWKRYINEKERPTMRLDLWNQGWLGWVPFTGEKVDTIEYCRKEVAILNQEIERQQSTPDKFPLMNSAFVQFNSQIAAHMACQSVTHHVPDQMAPRLVEISPGDVIWENMSFQWWERWLRTILVTAIIVAIIVFFVVPTAFIAALSQLGTLSKTFMFINRIPDWLQKAIQGILPPILTGLLLFLVPLVMRLLSKMRGTPTGMLVELDVSNYYFAFSFFELFIVITLSAGLLPIVTSLRTFDITAIPNLLATNIPKASNYYFSYLLLQGFSNSAGGLLQVVTLLLWFLWAPLNDNTPRQKWKRQINLPTVNWGSFFPVFTNLACIGLIYSVIAPLIIIFNLASFALFWFAYRYLTLYVDAFRYDTGGLLFPKAINQLFTGLYVMEICLIGLFFLVQGVKADGTTVSGVCNAQGIIMIVALVLTIMYQVRLNWSFGPLIRYLPITLEDEAAERDESFALMQRKRLGRDGNENEEDEDAEGTQPSLNEALEARERRSAEEIEMRKIGKPKGNELNEKDHIAEALHKNAMDNKERILYNNVATRGVLGIAKKPLDAVGLAKDHLNKGIDRLQLQQRALQQRLNLQLPEGIEAGLNSHGALSDALFAGMHSSLDELSMEERDSLTKEAFKHAALRARRPVVWIPNDELGVADDEIQRTRRYSSLLDISNEGTALNGKGQVIFGRSPPDFNEEDLIEL